jgi:YEATS domain-contaning protein 2
LQPSKEQTRIHPAVKKLLGTKKQEDFVIDMDVPETLTAASALVQPVAVDSEKKATQIMLSKQPRYIAPLDKPGMINKSPPRASNMKVKKRLVVGNVSKWIHADFRDDASTHKWMIYVRGPPDTPDVSDFVERVRFFLHSSYKPHDVIEIKYVLNILKGVDAYILTFSGSLLFTCHEEAGASFLFACKYILQIPKTDQST